MRSPPTIATTSANPKVKGVWPAAGPTRHPASHSTRRVHSIRRRQAAPGSSPDNSSAPGKGERPFNKEGATFPSRTIMRPPWLNNKKSPAPTTSRRSTRGLDGDRTHDLLFRPAQNWVKPASLDRPLKPEIPSFLGYRVSSLKPAKLAKSGGHRYWVIGQNVCPFWLVFLCGGGRSSCSSCMGGELEVGQNVCPEWPVRPCGTTVE